MAQVFDIHPHVALRARTRRPAGLWSRLKAHLGAKLQTARERRAIAALGPHGRQELHALLIASGGSGIPKHLWTARDWEDDARRF